MSAMQYRALARRLWAVRALMDDAYLVFDARRFHALERREEKLQTLLVLASRKGVTP